MAARISWASASPKSAPERLIKTPSTRSSSAATSKVLTMSNRDSRRRDNIRSIGPSAFSSLNGPAMCRLNMILFGSGFAPGSCGQYAIMTITVTIVIKVKTAPRAASSRNIQAPSLPIILFVHATGLCTMAENVVCQDTGHHRLTNGHGANADTGIMTPFG